MVRPYVVVHVAVSLEGAATGFDADIGLYYEVAATWHEDSTLVGADTILAQEAALATAPRPGPAEGGPLLAVVDGRGRVRQWRALREVGYWSEVLALHCKATPPRAGDRSVEEFFLGTERVDVAAALDVLGRRGCRVVRVDSGGGLTGAMLAAGLVDELSLLVHPRIAGSGGDRRWYGSAPPPASALHLVDTQTFEAGLVWLRYRLPR